MPQTLTHFCSRLHQCSLRVRIFLFFAALAGASALALVAGLYGGYARNPHPAAMEAVIIGGVVAGTVILGLIAGVWLLFDENVAKPIERLAGELRARTHTHITAELEDMTARHLGDLAPAATALMRHLNEARNELAEAIERETTRQALEKERLIRLLSDVPAGVLMCTADHQLALYNGQALELLSDHDPADVPCLARQVFDYLQEAPIRQAYENLLKLDDPDTELEFNCLACHGGRPLVARIRLLADTFARREGRPGYVLALHPATACLPSPIIAPRTVVYDFELLTKNRNAAIADTRLDDLTYVVFDTETTGLLPSSGDEIVQLAAVRIVNGRRIETEVLDTLVNPGRSIPQSSTNIHGITEAMVADAPSIENVTRRFHKFAQGAVLVAHNANFDMAFLNRYAQRLGLQFDNPVLDTVLLSAVVFGGSENHSLDALVARLGVHLPEEARHTAIGDAVATAEVLLKLLPALKARNVETFGELQAEMRRHERLLKNSNAW